MKHEEIVELAEYYDHKDPGDLWWDTYVIARKVMYACRELQEYDSDIYTFKEQAVDMDYADCE